MSKLSELIKEILYPSKACCYVCNSESVVGDDNLCDSCRSQLRLCVNPPAPYSLDGISIGLMYSEQIRIPMHMFKYSSHREYAAFFAQYMSIPDDWEIDIICPVPLHILKEMKRSYNQSELIARQISAIYQLPYCRDLLDRVKYTSSQTKLSPIQRKKNVRNVFRAAKECKGLSVLLVDDVYTTGATLVSCAEELRKKGAAKVYAICACKAES